VSVLYQVAFHIADLADDTSATELNVTRPLRLGLGITQLILFALMSLDLVQPHQRLVLFDSVVYGMLTVGMHMFHRTRLSQWDALFVLYGVAFYTLPKISPLQYVHCLPIVFSCVAFFPRAYSTWRGTWCVGWFTHSAWLVPCFTQVPPGVPWLWHPGVQLLVAGGVCEAHLAARTPPDGGVLGAQHVPVQPFGVRHGKSCT